MPKYIKNLLLSVLVISLSSSLTLAQVGDVDDNQDSCVNLTNNLRFRARDTQVNGEVSDLQDFLIDEGYMKGVSTGYFGKATIKSVKSFQSANNLISSGIIGNVTRAKIKEVSCGSANAATATSIKPTVIQLPTVITPDVSDVISAPYFIYNFSTKECAGGIFIGNTGPKVSNGKFVYAADEYKTEEECKNAKGANSVINLEPATLPSIIYSSKIQNNIVQPLYGFSFESKEYDYSNIKTSIVNTNINSISVASYYLLCDGVVNNEGAVCYNTSPSGGISVPWKSFVNVKLENPASLIDGQNYYFTIRITKNGISKDFYYSFVYKLSPVSSSSQESYISSVSILPDTNYFNSSNIKQFIVTLQGKNFSNISTIEESHQADGSSYIPRSDFISQTDDTIIFKYKVCGVCYYDSSIRALSNSGVWSNWAYTFFDGRTLSINNRVRAISSQLIDSKSRYAAGETIKFSIVGYDSTGVVASPAKGLHVQARMPDNSTNGDVFYVNGIAQAVNALYNYNTSRWDITMTAPFSNLPSGAARTIEAVFYCSQASSGCVDNEVRQSFTFSIF